MSLKVLIELQANLNKVREMKRIVKGILKNGEVAFKYETYLKKETSIRSAKTIQDYVNPRHSSAVFNTFKHLLVFLEKNRDWVFSLDPEGVTAFEDMNLKLVALKELNVELFKNAEVSKLYEDYLLYNQFTKGAAKRWSSPTCDMTGWFDSLEHLPNFLLQYDKSLRCLLEPTEELAVPEKE